MTPAAVPPLLLPKRVLRTPYHADLAARRAGIGPAFRSVSIANGGCALHDARLGQRIAVFHMRFLFTR